MHSRIQGGYGWKLDRWWVVYYRHAQQHSLNHATHQGTKSAHLINASRLTVSSHCRNISTHQTTSSDCVSPQAASTSAHKTQSHTRMRRISFPFHLCSEKKRRFLETNHIDSPPSHLEKRSAVSPLTSQPDSKFPSRSIGISSVHSICTHHTNFERSTIEDTHTLPNTMLIRPKQKETRKRKSIALFNPFIR